eukprot:scaffold127055_cov18-Tisochrysis_lutea.AAC.1
MVSGKDVEEVRPEPEASSLSLSKEQDRRGKLRNASCQHFGGSLHQDAGATGRKRCSAPLVGDNRPPASFSLPLSPTSPHCQPTRRSTRQHTESQVGRSDKHESPSPNGGYCPSSRV